MVYIELKSHRRNISCLFVDLVNETLVLAAKVEPLLQQNDLANNPVQRRNFMRLISNIGENLKSLRTDQDMNVVNKDIEFYQRTFPSAFLATANIFKNCRDNTTHAYPYKYHLYKNIHEDYLINAKLDSADMARNTPTEDIINLVKTNLPYLNEHLSRIKDYVSNEAPDADVHYRAGSYQGAFVLEHTFEETLYCLSNEVGELKNILANRNIDIQNNPQHIQTDKALEASIINCLQNIGQMCTDYEKFFMSDYNKQSNPYYKATETHREQDDIFSKYEVAFTQLKKARGKFAHFDAVIPIDKIASEVKNAMRIENYANQMLEKLNQEGLTNYPNHTVAQRYASSKTAVPDKDTLIAGLRQSIGAKDSEIEKLKASVTEKDQQLEHMKKLLEQLTSKPEEVTNQKDSEIEGLKGPSSQVESKLKSNTQSSSPHVDAEQQATNQDIGEKKRSLSETSINEGDGTASISEGGGTEKADNITVYKKAKVATPPGVRGWGNLNATREDVPANESTSSNRFNPSGSSS